MRQHRGEEGVSEMVGAMLLIGLTVLGVVLVGITFFSGSQPEEIPHTTIVAGNSTEGHLTLANYGGDPLRVGEYRIYVDYGDGLADRTDEFSEPDDSVWSIGEGLTYDGPGTPEKVIVTAISGGGETILAEAEFRGGAGKFSPDPEPGVTPGGTVTPAPAPEINITLPGPGDEIPTKDAEILANITSTQTKYVHMILYNYEEMQNLQKGHEIPGGYITGLNMTPTDFESIYTSGTINNLNNIGKNGELIAVVVIAYDENNEPIASLTKMGTLNKSN